MPKFGAKPILRSGQTNRARPDYRVCQKYDDMYKFTNVWNTCIYYFFNQASLLKWCFTFELGRGGVAALILKADHLNRYCLNPFLCNGFREVLYMHGSGIHCVFLHGLNQFNLNNRTLVIYIFPYENDYSLKRKKPHWILSF